MGRISAFTRLSSLHELNEYPAYVELPRRFRPKPPPNQKSLLFFTPLIPSQIPQLSQVHAAVVCLHEAFSRLLPCRPSRRNKPTARHGRIARKKGYSALIAIALHNNSHVARTAQSRPPERPDWTAKIGIWNTGRTCNVACFTFPKALPSSSCEGDTSC